MGIGRAILRPARPRLRLQQPNGREFDAHLLISSVGRKRGCSARSLGGGYWRPLCVARGSKSTIRAPLNTAGLRPIGSSTAKTQTAYHRLCPMLKNCQSLATAWLAILGNCLARLRGWVPPWDTDYPANNSGKSLRCEWGRLIDSLRLRMLSVPKGVGRFWQKSPKWLKCLILCALIGYLLKHPVLVFILPSIALKGSLEFKGSFKLDASADAPQDP